MKHITTLSLITTLFFSWTPMTATAKIHSHQASQQPELLQSNQQGGVLNKAKICYPPKAQMAGIEGWVELQINVDEAGKISAIEVLDAKPARIFEDAAMESVENWTFQQKLVDGKAKPYLLTQTVEFELVNYHMEDGQHILDQ